MLLLLLDNDKPENLKKEQSLLDNLLDEITPEEQARTDKKMHIAAMIADAIEAKGWGKKQLADKMGKKPSEITKWLSGTQNFTMDTLNDIGQILDIEFLNLSAISKKAGKTIVPEKVKRNSLKQDKHLALG